MRVDWRQTDHLGARMHNRAAAAEVVRSRSSRRGYQYSITLDHCKKNVVYEDLVATHSWVVSSGNADLIQGLDVIVFLALHYSKPSLILYQGVVLTHLLIIFDLCN